MIIKRNASKISIRGSVTSYYCILFLTSVILIFCILFTIITAFVFNDFTNTSSAVKNEISSRWTNIISNKENLNSVIKKARDVDAIYILDDNNHYLFLSGENIIDTNLSLQKDDGYYFYFLHKGYVINKISFINNKQTYHILLFFNIRLYANMFKMIIRWISVITVLVCIVFLLFGYLKTKSLLKPIDQMTSTTKLITAQNLDLRIDVSDAKYELKELAQTTNDMIDRLEAAYQNQQTFVSDVSHELRTPISVILGYANLLKRWGKDDPEVLDESIEAIINESENMKNLVNKLLFLARYDKETLKYEFSVVNLSNLVKETVKETEMVDDKHIIKSNIEDDIKIFADDNSIKEMIRVFVDNAIKYTKDGNEIFISVSKDKDNAILTIKDKGMGISYDDMGNIFKRFYRADESRNRDNGGHGLGLSIARAIVKDHKGKIKVKSKIDEGSTFDIYLPLYKKL